MIELSRSLIVNDGTQPELSVDDVWAGLQEKAANPMPYVKSITSCTVIDRFEGGLVRDIIHIGQPVREVVTFYPKRLVHFVRTHGSARGTIDNEIGHDENGALTLTNPGQFAELFAPDGKLVFANGDPMIGPAAIEAGVSGFFETIKGLRHAIVSEWHEQGDTVLELGVTYDRLDGKQVSIPVVTIFHRRNDGLIDDYRVFFDLAPVYA